MILNFIYKKNNKANEKLIFVFSLFGIIFTLLNITFSSSFDSSRVYYDKDNYYKSTWQWLDINQDGLYECYYFNIFGHMYKNSKTPDGYFVNEQGQLVIDNVVQYKTITELMSMFDGKLDIPASPSNVVNDGIFTTTTNNTYLAEVKDEFVEKLDDFLQEKYDELENYIDLKEVDKKLLFEIEGLYDRQMNSIYNTYYDKIVKLCDDNLITKNDLKSAKKVISDVLSNKEKALKMKLNEMATNITWILEPDEYKEYKKMILELR